MPFTLSHAAAALPFRKLQPVWPALVMGTFAPDLQYFIWISDEDRSGHQFPGILLLTIPLALSLLWLFEWCVKGPVIELLPGGLQRRLQAKVEPLSFWGWGRLATIILWMAVGIATHVFWDQFTHYHTWMGEHWMLLRRPVPVPFYSPMMLMKVLQHASTLFGILVLAAWFSRWYRRTAPVAESALTQFSAFRKSAVVLTMAVIATLAGYPLAILGLANHRYVVTPLFFIATLFEAMTLVFCVQLLIYGMARVIGAGDRRGAAAEVFGTPDSPRVEAPSE